MSINAAFNTPSVKKTDNSNQNTIELISGRQSNELVIAFCGAIGSGIKAIRESFTKALKINYDVRHVHISILMDNMEKRPSIYNDSYERYIEKQKQGNRLREKYSSQILAESAIYEITKIKEKLKSEHNIPQDDKFKGRVVYLIDQLKNLAEVELLRLVYQNNFYLVGVLRNESERKRNLRDENIPSQKIDELIHLDRKSGGAKGQQVEKTILDADFFIRNNQSHSTYLDSKVERFIDLIHGKNGVSPSFHEKGMFNAFSSSLQSACLSRQVGAAILDANGNVIATGRNDVPKAGGGLYTYEDSQNDYRCVHKGQRCYNDLHKSKIKKGIEQQVKKGIKSSISDNELIQIKGLTDSLLEQISGKITEEIYENTSVSSLIEFSRAIHAEMDAITSLARTGTASTQGKIMFTTTFPCHSCARHIVACGIKEVYYIQPYEKSLALDLHDDAINDINSENPKKVSFIQFDGISPRRYSKFFFSTADRKDSNSGFAIDYPTKYKNHVDIQLIDDYQDMELKISEFYYGKVLSQDVDAASE